MNQDDPRPDAPANLMPWKVFNGSGEYAGIVIASNAVGALKQVPPGHSIYVGGPSPEHPDRQYWAKAWRTEAIDSSELVPDVPGL